MPHIAIKEVTLQFASLDDISRFKQECLCNDFYVDRDAITLIGFFKEENIQLAVEKFGGVLKVKPW